MIIDNPFISGSLNVQNDVTASNIQILGSASAAYFTGSFVGDGSQLDGVTSYTDQDTLDYINTLGVLSGSAQIASDISGSFTSLSSSLEQRISSQESFSSSLDATFATDAQVATAVSALNAATSSYALQADISGAFALTSSSLAQRVSAQEEFSSSLNATFATDQELSDVSGALALSISSISTDFNDITNKPTLISSSFQFNDLTSPFTGSFTGSFIGDGTQLTGVTSYTDQDTLDYINSLGVVSGSSQVNSGSFSGSFEGDGSGLTNLTVAQVATVSAEFTSATSTVVTHNFNSRNVIVSVYDDSNLQLIPENIELTTLDTVTVTFPTAKTGTVVVAKGGHIVSGSVEFDSITNKPTLISSSAQFTDITAPFTGSFTGSFVGDGSNLSGVTSYTDADTLSFIQGYSGSYTGSFIGDGTQLTGVTSYTDADTLEYINSLGVISGSVPELTTVTASFNNTGSVTIPHSFNSKNVSVNVYDSNDIYIIPQQITLVDNNSVKIDFAGNTTGFAVVSKGGHIVSGSVLVPQVSHISDAFTNTTSHTVNHKFNTKEVIVSVYENDSLIIPDTVTTDDLNNVTVTFPEAISGRVVVVKAGHIVSGSLAFDNLIDTPLTQGTNAITASKHIVPSQDITYDLGSSDLRFRDLYLSSASIYLGNTVISEDNVVTTASLASVLPANVVSSSAQIASDISGSFTSVSESFASERLKNTTDTLDGDLTVTGKITAQEFHTEFISASIIYQSGSTKFGDSNDDRHLFTGRIGIGTDSPSTDLEISSTNPEIYLTDTSASPDGGIVKLSNVNTDFIINVDPDNVADSSTIQFELDGTERMRLNANGFGIGAVSPQDLLHVYSEIADANLMIQSTNTNGDARLKLIANSGGFSQIRFEDEADSNVGLLTYQHSDNSMQFRTNDSERMRIDSSGRVGIGTTSPSTTLDVQAAASYGRFKSTTGTNSTYINFENTAGNFWVGRDTSTGASFGGSNYAAVLYSQGAYPMEFWTNSGRRLVIDSTGNVGIGTSSPDLGGISGTRVLTIASPETERWGILELAGNRTWGGNQVGELKFISTDATNNGTLVSLTAINDPTSTGTGGSLKFSTRPNGGTLTERMRINSNGDVGIGTTSTSAKLTIDHSSSPRNYQIDFIGNSSTAKGHIGQFANGTYLASNWYYNGGQYADDYSRGQSAIILGSGGADTSYIQFSLSTAGASSPSEKVRILNSGGITFNGDTAAANALDDYEEGTWTPSIGTSNDGIVSATYQFRSGTYQKIGNSVYCRFGFKLSSIGAPISGTVRVYGLPYTSAVWGSYQEPNFSVSTGLLATADYAHRARMFVYGGTTYLEGRIANNGDTSWGIGEFSGDEWIIAEFFYNLS